MHIDDWLYTKIFDPIAHQAEARTGISRFSLSRCGLVPYGAWALMPLAKWPIDISDIMVVFVGLTNVGLGVLNAYMAEAFLQGRGTANVYRHAFIWRMARGFWLAVTAVDFLVVVYGWDLTRIPQLLADLGYMVHVFFLGCSAMPPSLPREIAERAAQRSGRVATVEG